MGNALHQQGHTIQQVYSRTFKKAKALAKQIDAKATNNLKKINPSAQLYLLAVSDGAIVEVATKIASTLSSAALVVHTSGATPAKSLSPFFKSYGTFYPLQSFSKGKAVDFSSIPFCIHANRKKQREQLASLAKCLSPAVYFLDDQQRAILHVAAVFANNFTNHLFHISQSLLQGQSLPFELLQPLILETAAKVQAQSPSAMQTGPAIRGDQKTIEQHLSYLKKQPEIQKLYLLLTESIQSNHSK
ncbi:MAG: Rossmann-like and DUF2520 domain-containing protein [Bacteroidota bacterium]